MPSLLDRFSVDFITITVESDFRYTQLALCCDILIAAEGAFLAMTEVDVGLAGGVSHVRRILRGIRRTPPNLYGTARKRS